MNYEQILKDYNDYLFEEIAKKELAILEAKDKKQTHKTSFLEGEDIGLCKAMAQLNKLLHYQSSAQSSGITSKKGAI